MSPLARRLAAEIAQDGPITTADFMARCLWDPTDGYYATRVRVGAEGDFLTASTGSQMFGELLGLWAAAVWDQIGRPSHVRLVEVGPGDGALIVQALKAARLVAGFLDAAELVLVEPSPVLRREQQAVLTSAPLPVRWVDDVGALTPDRPTILLANEVLDCLPARQFERTGQGWVERRIGIGEDGALGFVRAPAPAGFTAPCNVELGHVVELSPAQEGFASTVAALIVQAGGVALLVDYGRGLPEPGDTLQALKAHQKVDPLLTAGEADLTVWADFPGVLAAARTTGAAAAGPLGQGDFLMRLGLAERAAALARQNLGQRETIERQLHWLTSPDQMGVLFKTVCLYKPGQPTPPGFDAPDA